MSITRFEGGGHVPEGTITNIGIRDGSLVAQDLQEADGPDQGHAAIGVPLIIRKDASAASASIDIFTADCPYKLKIEEVIIECVGANGSGTVKLTDGTNDITDEIVCAVDEVVNRAGTIADAYSTIAKDGTLSIVKNAAADKAFVKIIAVRVI